MLHPRFVEIHIVRSALTFVSGALKGEYDSRTEALQEHCSYLRSLLYTGGMSATTARQRARDEITAEIIAAARARLRSQGPGELSLRAVARDVGMVSSAVYRYFSSRDELLTSLLLVAYNELGAHAEGADADVSDRENTRERWLTTCRAVREWALNHPGDYALLYGSPVAGYAAPAQTIEPAIRVPLVLAGIVQDAHINGASPPARPQSGPSADELVAGAMNVIGGQDLDGEIVLRTVMAWTSLVGTVSFELFGHLVGTTDDYASYFDAVAIRLAADLGI